MCSIPLVFMIFARVNQVELNNYLTPNVGDNHINDLPLAKLSLAKLKGIGRNDLCLCGSGTK